MKLCEVIQSFYDTNSLKASDMEIRHSIVMQLKSILGPELTIFGSSINGFGTKDGDIDLYLKGPNSMDEIHNSLKRITKILENSTENLFADIAFINSMNVPIIKCRHRATNQMIDLSQNAKMSVHNTLLLKAYTTIDPTVSVLGCFLKAMAKSAGIADPPKRSLSSFGWSLMMIHFLQQCNVLPVLQEIYASTLKSFTAVDSFNDIDIGNLARLWPELGRNEQSVAELWLGFLKYYSEFDFTKFVITISRLSPMVKTYWIDAAGIAIQNPFEWDQNVAQNLFEEMSYHIIQTIRHWKKFFDKTTSFDAHQTLFTDDKIKYAPAPVHSYCYRCGEKGHSKRNCLWDDYEEYGYYEEDFAFEDW